MTTSEGIRISIVGAGPNCCYALDALLRTAHSSMTGRPLDIAIFEATDDVGSGNTHSTRTPDTAVLNRIAGQISLGVGPFYKAGSVENIPGYKSTFMEWAEERYEATGDSRYLIEQSDWPKRSMFGEAMSDTFSLLVNELRRTKGINVKIINEEVVDVARAETGSGYDVITSSGHRVAADKVLFATGVTRRSAERSSFLGNLIEDCMTTGCGIVSDPYPMQDQLTHLVDSEEVFVVGTGTSAIDIIGYLNKLSQATVDRGLIFPISPERCDPRFIPNSRLLRWVRHMTYPLASTVVVQTQQAAEYFPHALHTEVVPNPVVAEVPDVQSEGEDEAPGEARGPLLVAMGRLTRQKGFDVLIEAFSAIADRHPEWSLWILGEGSCRQSLQEAVEREGLGGRVSLPGVVTRPGRVLARADLFVLSSRFEGFPNALCEAMCRGLPVIASDCPSGPREIVREGIDGCLVPCEDVQALARALDKLMGDPIRRAQLGARAKDVIRRFAVDDIMGRWEAVIHAVEAHDGAGRPA